jgi:predicted nucleotidyltransferase
MMEHLSEKDQQTIINYLVDHVHAFAVILFGSTAKGTMRPDSDVDIAFMSEVSLLPYELFMKAQELADMLGREVDLIDFKQASSVFKAQIIGGGQLLLDQEPIKRQYSFMRALKEYAQLNEERQVILDNLGYGGGSTGDQGRRNQQNGEYTSMRK